MKYENKSDAGSCNITRFSATSSVMDILDKNLVAGHNHRAKGQLLLAEKEKFVDRFITRMCAGKVWVEVPAKYIHCTVITSLSLLTASPISLSH